MNKYRFLPTGTWSDDTFLKMSPEQKLIDLYLWTSPYTSLCGIFKLSITTMGHFIGLKNDNIESAFKGYLLAYPDRTKYDKETGEVALLLWPKLALVNANIAAKKKAERELEEVQSIELLKAVISRNSATLSKPYLFRIRQLQMEEINRKKELEKACAPYQIGNASEVPENEQVSEQKEIVIVNETVNESVREKIRTHAKNPTEAEPKKDTDLTAEVTLEKEKGCAKKEKEPVLVDDGFLTDPVPEEIPDLGGPDWMTVAQDMARYYEDPNGRGPSEWEMQCMAAGGYVKPLIITTIWAGKNQDAPYLLKNWKKHTGKLTNWIKNNLKSDRQHEAKIKSLNNGKRKSTDPLITGDAMAKAYRELMAEGYR